MRKWITLLMTLLVTGSCVSYANAYTGQVSLEAGYRRDNINWRSRFPSDSPFLTTSTRFKDIDIFQISAYGRSTIGCNFYVRANAYWGWILDGDFEESVSTYFSQSSDSYNNGIDFGFSNDRHNVIDDRYVYGVSAALGYPFYFCDCTMFLAPVVGYSFDEQNFRIDDEGFNLHEAYGVIQPRSGSECCDHKWANRWYGPFVGVDFNYRPYNECWNFYAELEYHWGNFNARRHENRNLSFDHFGFGRHRFHADHVRAWVFTAGADYDLSNCWTVGFSVKFQDWSASRHHRHHDSFSSDSFLGGDDYNLCCNSFSGRERNNFKWRSYAINLAIGHDF